MIVSGFNHYQVNRFGESEGVEWSEFISCEEFCILGGSLGVYFHTRCSQSVLMNRWRGIRAVTGTDHRRFGQILQTRIEDGA